MQGYKDLKPGDSVRFKYRDEEHSAAVLPMLVFDDHVVVRFGACGHVVDDSNFIRIIRRKKTTGING